MPVKAATTNELQATGMYHLSLIEGSDVIRVEVTREGRPRLDRSRLVSPEHARAATVHV